MFLCHNPLLVMHLPTDIDAPKDLKATDVTLESASLTWIPPLADIEGYILTYRDEDGNMEVLSHEIEHTQFLTQTETKPHKKDIWMYVSSIKPKRFI